MSRLPPTLASPKGPVRKLLQYFQIFCSHFETSISFVALSSILQFLVVKAFRWLRHAIRLTAHMEIINAVFPCCADDHAGKPYTKMRVCPSEKLPAIRADQAILARPRWLGRDRAHQQSNLNNQGVTGAILDSVNGRAFFDTGNTVSDAFDILGTPEPTTFGLVLLGTMALASTAKKTRASTNTIGQIRHRLKIISLSMPACRQF